jgi:hypothetical protein
MAGQAARVRLNGQRIEDRKIKRASRRLMVRFGAHGTEKTGFSRNISQTGVFLATNSVFQPGSTIQVQIHFPERTWSLWAKVAWAKKVPPNLAHILDCGMGLHFVETGPEWIAFFDEWKRKNGMD